MMTNVPRSSPAKTIPIRVSSGANIGLHIFSASVQNENGKAVWKMKKEFSGHPRHSFIIQIQRQHLQPGYQYLFKGFPVDRTIHFIAKGKMTELDKEDRPFIRLEQLRCPGPSHHLGGER